MFDNVLSQGDQVYLKALNKGLIVLEQGVEFLSIDNLPKVVGVSGCSSMFSYNIIDTVNLQPVISDLPISIHAFASVSPWLLCIVRAQASLRGNCCLSLMPISVCYETVIGHIGMHNGLLSINAGPL